jgi:magnesium and cobalt exporter, CNNM family
MLLILILVSLLLSAFFSGSEIAFVAANKLRVEVSARRSGPVGKVVTRFLNDPSTLLTTTLVGNNLALVIYSTLFALYMQPVLESFFVGTVALTGASIYVAVLTTQTLIASTILLIFCEIIPKSVMREVANSAVFALALPLRFTYFLLLPLIKLAQWSASLIVKMLKADETVISTFMRRDFELMLEESKRNGELDLDQEEGTLVSNVFAMSSIRVKESMIPRTEIIAVEDTATVAELQDTFVKSGYSKIPVYAKNIENIVGIAFARDLFEQPRILKEIIRPATFIPESKLSKKLLQEFLESNTSIAIVIDEYGGVAGLVTREDLLEELFGDIQDEFDNDDHILRQIDDDTVLASGRIELDELSEEVGFDLPDGDYETVAGFLLEKLGTIPVAREEFILDGFRFVILQATSNRVDLVRIARSEVA